MQIIHCTQKKDTEIMENNAEEIEEHGVSISVVAFSPERHTSQNLIKATVQEQFRQSTLGPTAQDVM